MKGILLLLTLLFPVPALRAQTQISGTVTDSKNKPVDWASVRIKSLDEGTRTDSAGFFSLTTAAHTGIVLVISSIGYITREINVAPADTNPPLKIVLEEEARQLGEVIVVGAGSFEASDKARGASLTPMDAVTVAGSGGDIANSLRALPGVQQIGESEGLFVRGGSSGEAKQFIDGVLFPNTNYTPVPGIMQPARLNAFLYKGILFNTGGYSALYGDALSSALILETVDLPDRSEAKLHLFPTSQGAGFQHLSTSKQQSFGATISYSNAGWYNKVVPQKPDYFHGPEYLSGDFNFRIRTSKTGILKFYTNYGYNHIGLKTPDIDSGNLLSLLAVEGHNSYSNLSYKETPGRSWKIEAALGYNYNKEAIQTALLGQQDEKIFVPVSPFDNKNSTNDKASHLLNGKIMLTKRLPRRQALRLGAEYTHNDVQYQGSLAGNSAASSFAENAAALFAEGDITVSRKIAVRAGLRSEYSALLEAVNLAPRLSVAYKPGSNDQLNLAYGLFYQKPSERLLLGSDDNLGYMQAAHYVLNYQRKASNRMLRAEVFYKTYRNLVTTGPYNSNDGDGYAGGFELFFRDKRTIKGLDYWVSYSYLDTKRKDLDYPYRIAPSYTTPHTFSLAIKKFFPDLNFSANMSYAFATGRPYYDIRTGKDGTTSIYDEGTTQAYHNINLSFAYLFTLFKRRKDYSGIGFGLNNLLGREQVFGYRYRYDGNVKAPITLPATRFYYIGFFMSLGTDRRDDFIDQQL